MPVAEENLTVEFGVCVERDGRSELYHVPISNDVADVGLEMLRATRRELRDGLPKYEPAEKMAAREACVLALDHPLAERIIQIRDQGELDTNASALESVGHITYYFFTFRDRNGVLTVGLRRSSHFKALVHSRLIFMQDSLVVERRPMFRLDSDFDVLIDDERILILRTSAFEYIAGIESRVLEIARATFEQLKQSMSFMDLSELDELVGKSSRAARLAAAIGSRSDLADLTKERLALACGAHGIAFKDDDGVLRPSAATGLDFLKLLDRRLYNDPLAESDPMGYEAPSRVARKRPTK